jgi:hypothetical protein
LVLFALFATAMSAAPSSADDLFPPPWRGGPLTTVAEWDFSTDTGLNNPLAPDGTSVPTVVGDGGNGQGGTGPLATPMGDLVWDPVFNGSWISRSGGEIIFDIPNWIDNEPFKLISVQITMQPQGSNPPRPMVVSVTGTDPTGPVTCSLIDVFETPPDIDGIILRQEHWALFPNPDYEQIIINLPQDTVVAQVVIDTISRGIPEPSTLAIALLLGPMVGLTRRQRC